jgi:hypothetical protein
MSVGANITPRQNHPCRVNERIRVAVSSSLAKGASESEMRWRSVSRVIANGSFAAVAVAQPSSATASAAGERHHRRYPRPVARHRTIPVMPDIQSHVLRVESLTPQKQARAVC